MKFGSCRIHNSTLLVVLTFVFWLAIFRYQERHQAEDTRITKGKFSFYKRMPRTVKYKFLPPIKIFLNEESYVDNWQRANSLSETYKLLVFAAYFDGRTADKCVRIIGATLTKKPPTVYCKLFFENEYPEIITSKNKAINEHQNLKYSAFFFNCCYKTKDVPRMVSISSEKDFKNSAEMLVHHNRKLHKNYTAQFAICVKPFHYEYNRATWLLEFLEFNRLMGVEHFFFYNHTVGPDVELILKSYLSLGLATVIPWKLDLVSQKEIRTEGIFAALNDCLYRTMYRYKYVLMIDFDEYFVPRTVANYGALIENVLSTPTMVHRQKTSSYVPSSYVFKNVFFYLYWENDTASFGDVPENAATNFPYLLTQYKTRRLVSSTPRGRTKYIVYPEAALEAGNHVVWRGIKDSGSVKVEESMAVMHHYRICEFGGFDCLKRPSMVDRTAHRFNTSLIARIMDQCRNIFPLLDGICPISPPLGSPW